MNSFAEVFVTGSSQLGLQERQVLLSPFTCSSYATYPPPIPEAIVDMFVGSLVTLPLTLFTYFYVTNYYNLTNGTVASGRRLSI